MVKHHLNFLSQNQRPFKISSLIHFRQLLASYFASFPSLSLSSSLHWMATRLYTGIQWNEQKLTGIRKVATVAAQITRQSIAPAQTRDYPLVSI